MGKEFHKQRNTLHNPIITGGEIFPDGKMLELVSISDTSHSPQLLLWDGREARIAPNVEHGGGVYEVAHINSTLCRALRLPSGPRDYRSDRDLFEAVQRLWLRHLGLGDWESSMLTMFVFTSWMHGRPSTTPLLMILSEDDEAGLSCLQLLHALCRHALLLAELSPAAFCSIPMQLSPTLLVRQEELRPNLQRLLRASAFQGLHVLRSGGRLTDLSCPKAIFFGNGSGADAFCDNAIPIVLTSFARASLGLEASIQRQISTDFQDRLLMYRLRHLTKQPTREVDVSRFTPRLRPLARSVAQCFPGDDSLAEFAVGLLEPQDQQVREERSRDVNFAIVETLLAGIHSRKNRTVRVQELTTQVNTLLRSRGEIVEYSPEEIGWRLEKLGIVRHSKTSGKEILLDRNTSKEVHRLARVYNLPDEVSSTDCPDCAGTQTSVSE